MQHPIVECDSQGFLASATGHIGPGGQDQGPADPRGSILATLVRDVRPCSVFAETGDLLQRIVAERTIVVIEHDMDFVRRFADLVTVMHSGKVLAEGTVAEIQADQQVQDVYLGTTTEATHG